MSDTNTLSPCGTRAAYTRHKRRGEQPCEPCRRANVADGKPARIAYSIARQRAYSALRELHRQEFIEILAVERAAEPVAGTQDERNLIRSRTEQRALRELSRRHAAEFVALRSRERGKIAAAEVTS